MSDLLKQVEDGVESRTGHLTHKVLSKYSASENGEAKYIKLTQVRAATGWADLNTADIMIMGSWPSSGGLLEGFEVKVSRADWLNEVNKPNKNRSVKSYCDKWWLVISDETMVNDGELPEDWGMMALRKGNLVVVKDAPILKPEPMDNLFVASLLRHNTKEHIPVDVHNDKIMDYKREFEAVTKRKYGALLDYVKFLHKHLGIKIEVKEEQEWRNGKYEKYFKEWAALTKREYRGHTPEEIVAIIKAAIDGDLKHMVSEMNTIRRWAKQLIDESDNLRPTPNNNDNKEG